MKTRTWIPLNSAHTSLVLAALWFIISDYLFIFSRITSKNVSLLSTTPTPTFSSFNEETEITIWSQNLLSHLPCYFLKHWSVSHWVSTFPVVSELGSFLIFKASSSKCAHPPHGLFLFSFIFPESLLPMSTDMLKLFLPSSILFSWLCARFLKTSSLHRPLSSFWKD